MDKVNPLNDHAFLSKLVVGIGEVSEITGIPTRQIRYWEEKGIIASLGDKQATTRRYDYQAIKKMILIKELLDEGYTLKAAAQKLNERLDRISSALDKLK